MNRRNLLRRALALPLAGATMKADLARGMHTGILGVGMGTGGAGVPEAGGSTLKRFRSWKSFWDATKESAKREAAHIHQIDPDLCAMESLPFNTKFRIQRRRNYERIERAQESWFLRVLRRDGHVKRYE